MNFISASEDPGPFDTEVAQDRFTSKVTKLPSPQSLMPGERRDTSSLESVVQCLDEKLEDNIQDLDEKIEDDVQDPGNNLEDDLAFSVHEAAGHYNLT